MTGSNGDANRILRGSLKLQPVDSTHARRSRPSSPARRATTASTRAPSSVKWNIVEEDSRILERSGCDDVAVSEDTGGTTYTCSATSHGGTATQSVTVKRDTAAPELTVPAVLVSQATGAGGAALTYAATGDGPHRHGAERRVHLGLRLDVPARHHDRHVHGHRRRRQRDRQGLRRDRLPRPAGRAAEAARSSRRSTPSCPSAGRSRTASTRLVALKVKDIPAGSTVTVSCTGKSCPKTLKGSGTTRFSKSSSVTLTTLVKGGFKSGTAITVKVSSPGADDRGQDPGHPQGQGAGRQVGEPVKRRCKLLVASTAADEIAHTRRGARVALALPPIHSRRGSSIQRRRTDVTWVLVIVVVVLLVVVGVLRVPAAPVGATARGLRPRVRPRRRRARRPACSRSRAARAPRATARL